VELTVTASAVVAPEAQVNLPVEVTVPLLTVPTVMLPPIELPTVLLPRTGLPPVTLPPVELPRVTVPPPDPLPVAPPGSPPAVAIPPTLADERAAPVGGKASTRAAQRTTRTAQDSLTGTGTAVFTARPASTLSMHTWAMLTIGPPVVAIVDEWGQRFRTAKVPDSVGPTATALVLAAAIGAAATGTAGSGSAGASGLAVLSSALGPPALGGSGRLSGRLRESAFRRPRIPGFSPD
jgi:hypothetical protein